MLKETNRIHSLNFYLEEDIHSCLSHPNFLTMLRILFELAKGAF